MWRLQFILSLGDSDSTVLAYPHDKKEGEAQRMRLTHSAFDTILYGSEHLAIDDIDRWARAFPWIIRVEAIQLNLQGD